MKTTKLTKIIEGSLIALSVLALNPIGASAQWRENSTGWWYSEGSSYAKGLTQIDGKSYYFDSNGYMKTGWINDRNKYYDNWYYCYSNGEMAKDTVIDGYVIGIYGEWVEGVTKDEVEQYKKLIYEKMDIKSNQEVKVNSSGKNMSIDWYKDFHINDGICFKLIETPQDYEPSTIFIDKDNNKVYELDGGRNLVEWSNKERIKNFKYTD